jgi:molybdate transport system ATP-binding protein
VTLSATICARLSSAFTLDVRLVASAGMTMILGTSGSGKTTLLRCLAGLHRPDAGEITIGDRTVFRSVDRSGDGESRTDGSATEGSRIGASRARGGGGRRSIDTPTRHRNVGYVFQHLALFPHMTAAENIEYGLATLDAAARRERTRAIADSFHIAHLLDRKPDAISGGERQRVALARSLVTDPHLLLLDEPLSARDLATQSRIIGDLRIWNATHRIPILYVTHAHREVFALGERVVVLQRGTIVANGTPHEVLDTPAQETIAQLAGFENLLPVREILPHPDAGSMTCRLEPTTSVGMTTELEVPLTNVPADRRVPLRVAIRAGDIMLATEEPRGLSARNVLPGIIASVRREGVTVIVHVDAGCRFEVHVTPSAAASLRLAPSQSIWLVLKTHSCRLVAGEAAIDTTNHS